VNELPTTKPSDLHRLRWLADSRATSPEKLTELASCQDAYVRFYVAMNPNTPCVVLERLACDEDFIVQIGVAKNTAASLELLAVMAQDPWLRASATDTFVRKGKQLFSHKNRSACKS